MTHDPDLMQAIEDLRYVVSRIRQLEGMVADSLNNPMQFRQVRAIQQERSDQIDVAKSAAVRLNLPVQALILLVEEWWRVNARQRRKPDARTVATAVKTIVERANTAEAEAHAEFEFARVARQQASARATAAAAALAYIRANEKAAA